MLRDGAEKSTFAAPASATSGLSNYDHSGKKSSKRKASYTNGPVTKDPCRDCTMFQAPKSCTAVRGSISPNGHCNFFKRAASKAKEPTAMDELKLFIPLTKVDIEKRLVYGLVTAELPDVSGEVCDYATTKPLYEKWSGEFAKTTDGKSLGNLRVMHGNVAAGKVAQLDFDDDNKKISICGKVVDDAEWNKVLEGVYTGFSQGGKYVKRWKDGEHTKYTAEPIEISLVDSPCLKEATFQVVKADGSTELRKFKEPAAEPTPPNEDGDWEQVWVSKRLPGKEFKSKADLRKALLDLDAEEAAKKTAAPVLDALTAVKDKLAKAGGEPTKAAQAAPDSKVEKKDFTDDERKKLAGEGKAMKDGSFPIENKSDLENAIKAYGRAKNKAAAKRHIIKRAKALGATDLLPADWTGSTKGKDKDSKKSAADADLTKGADLWSISDLLLLLDGVSRMEENAELPSWSFGNAVDLPKDLCDRFGAALVELGDIAAEMLDVVLESMKDEEATEALAAAARAGDLLKLAKVGAKHSKTDKDHIKKAHDHLVSLDPDCCPAEDDDDDAEKMIKSLQGQIDANTSAFAKTLDGIMDMVKTIAEQPMPMGTSSVNLHIVDKAQDNGSLEALTAKVEAAQFNARHKRG